MLMQATLSAPERRPAPASDVAGKVAIVTGSTSGIGLGIARAFAAAGIDVVINGLARREEAGEVVTELAREFGVRSLYSAADMSKPADVRAMVEETADALGQVDILVNNTGIQHVEAIETFPPEKWDSIIAIDLSSAFHAIRAALPGMKERGWGRIINVASAHALVASPFKSAYVAAKHGILGLTRTVALEAAEHGVTAKPSAPVTYSHRSSRSRSRRRRGRVISRPSR